MTRHHASLFDDIARDRTLAAARRRRRRRFGNGVAMVATFAAVAGLILHEPSTDTPVTATSIPPEPAGESITASAIPACRLASDDELLEVLADQGPMLVTAADGQHYLVLTRLK